MTAMVKSMKRAVVYARVSTERQAEEGLSIDSQIDACRAKAAELGAVVLQVYRDEGITGRTDARPGFRAAIHRCSAGGVDFLICWSSSRFARDQHDAIVYKRELAAHGTRLVYAQSGIDLTTMEGWMLDSFQQVMDEHYSRQVSADTKRSMMKAAGEGYFMGGRVPYGYEPVQASDGRRRRLAPLEHEAMIVRLIYRQAVEGVGALTIARELNDQGVTMRGSTWRKGTVLAMLKSEVYMGRVIYNRFDRKTRRPRPETAWTRVQAHPELVSEAQWTAAQLAISGRAPDPGAVPHNTAHVFAGLMRCGHCGSSLQMTNGTGRGGRLYHYYACRGHHQGQRCQFKPVPADAFDERMLQDLLDRVLTEAAIQQVLDGFDAQAARWVKDRAARRMSMVLELRTAEARRQKLFDVLEEQGRNTPGLQATLDRVSELSAQIRRLEVALTAIEDEPEPTVGPARTTAAEAAAVMRRCVEEAPDAATLRAFVASVVDHIVINAATVVVHYSPECLVQMDGASVRSEHMWLPVPARLRTATVTIPIAGWRRGRLAA